MRERHQNHLDGGTVDEQRGSRHELIADLERKTAGHNCDEGRFDQFFVDKCLAADSQGDEREQGGVEARQSAV